MMRQIKESDWKILRELHKTALERFCKKTLSEVVRINSDGTKTFHERYLAVFRRLRERDKEISQVFDDLRRSNGLFQLAGMMSRGLLTQEEFSRFSQETREAIALLGD